MNGRKILIRLILVFAVLNGILLLANIYSHNSRYVLSNKRVSQLNTFLESRAIGLEETLPIKYEPKKEASLSFIEDSTALRESLKKSIFGAAAPKVQQSVSEENEQTVQRIFTLNQVQMRLQGHEVSYINHEIPQKSENSLSMNEAKRYCDSFLSKLEQGKAFSRETMKAYSINEGWKLIYYPIYDGLPVFDIYICFEVYEKGIYSAKIILASIEETGVKAKPIYPADQAIFALLGNVPEISNTKIREVTLGYQMLTESRSNIWDKQVVPAYKIVIDGLEAPIFVNAYTNELIR